MNNKVIQIKILYEDNDIIVADKPAGLVVYDLKGTEPSLVEQFKKKIDKKLLDEMPERGGLVHRLDKDTSGVIILAKNKPALENLQKQFKERSVKKEYLAVVDGVIDQAGVIDLPIGRVGVGRMTISSYKNKPAKTYFEPISKTPKLQGPAPQFTFLRIKPETGRTHQIRVHLASIGHGIVGDRLYGSKSGALGRMMLHALSITFSHPKTGKRITVSSTAPFSLDENGITE